MHLHTRRILVYADAGVGTRSLHHLLAALRDARKKFSIEIECVNAKQVRHPMCFMQNAGKIRPHLLIMPGGRDTPYHEALRGEGNANIRAFVQSGGAYLGICAGAYYGCSRFEFEVGNQRHEIVAERELQFFPGSAVGPAYGPGRFEYSNENGARISLQRVVCAPGITADTNVACYFNGGCRFERADAYDGVTVVARYDDLASHPASVVCCHIGSGVAVLSGVHPEYSSAYVSCGEHGRASALNDADADVLPDPDSLLFFPESGPPDQSRQRFLSLCWPLYCVSIDHFNNESVWSE